ncbi:MAG: sigma-70 family RNA polymerase sigma factor [Planctomycetota bacterium]|nr:sigma-70 family RNA polymerase sigma factor [Planctomycetota bacterium]
MSEKEEPMNYSADWQMISNYQELLLKVANSRIERRFGARLDPADIVQNTLMQAVSGLRNGSQPVDMKAWLLDILGKKITDAIRQCTAQKRNVNREVSNEPGNSNLKEIEYWLRAEMTSPSEGAVRNERTEQLQTAILQLPMQQQKAINHRFKDGLSTVQIAVKLETSERAVAGLLWRGMKRIAELMKPYRDEEGDSQS